MKKKKIVVIGGGNGSALAINALKNNPNYELSAVVPMSDSNFSSGAMRRYFDLLPPGDILRAVLALSVHDYSFLKKIFFTKRFDGLVNINKKLKANRGPNLGNLFIMLVAQFEGDFVRAIRALEEVVDAQGHAYPATLAQMDLCAQLSNGLIIKTEAAIDRPNYNRSIKIKKAWLEPKGKIYSGAKAVIEKADYIVILTGSLYTSVIATLLVSGVKAAIKKSSAKIIYVFGPAREKNGETGPDNFSGFVNELESYLPRPVDQIIYHHQKPTPKQLSTYRQKDWERIKVDIQNLPSRKLVAGSFECSEGGIDSTKLGKILKRVIK